MADEKTITIDPRVALQETAAKAEADDAFYRNRCLLLAQTVLDLQTANAELQAIIAEQNAVLGGRPEADR